MGKTTLARFAMVSCSHCPFQRPESVDWVLQTLATIKPRITNFIFGGDLFESDAASVWPNETDHTLHDEYEEGAHLLTSLRKVLPRTCKRVWLLGNHDDNIQTTDARRIPKKLRGLVHWNASSFREEFLRWPQVPYIKSEKGLYSLGQAIFAHGWDYGQTSDEIEAVQISYLAGGHAHRLVSRGHTHRPVSVTQALRTRTAPLALHYANVGTIGTLKPRYMARASTILWGPAILIGEADLDFDPLGGPQWSAQLLRPGDTP